jgi:lysozyme family protein
MHVPLTDALRSEYMTLYEVCQIRPAKRAACDAVVAKIVANRGRYDSVGKPLNIPWYVVAVLHSLEASLDFNAHLHNGDPLSARTVHVPKGRPIGGDPPFTWEESASDALIGDGLYGVKEWSLPSILYRLEGFNGFGYRTQHHDILSPYLWSFSQHYRSGKYVGDSVFDPKAVSDQCGAALLLKGLSALNLFP